MLNCKLWHKESKGQGIVEYIVLMAAVIAVLMMFFMRRGVFEKSYNYILTLQGEEMVNSAEIIFGRPGG